MNVLVEILGKQFKVDKGDKIKVPYINKKVGEKLTFDKVMYIEDGDKKEIGNPYIKGKNIEAKIVQHGSFDKVIVFKMKRRKGYQKRNGHKQKFSLIEISKIGNSKKSTSKKAENDNKSTAKKTTVKKTTVNKTTAKKSTAKKKADK
jgi:large subunit ribosomal protein L21